MSHTGQMADSVMRISPWAGAFCHCRSEVCRKGQYTHTGHRGHDAFVSAQIWSHTCPFSFCSIGLQRP